MEYCNNCHAFIWQPQLKLTKIKLNPTLEAYKLFQRINIKGLVNVNVKKRISQKYSMNNENDKCMQKFIEKQKSLGRHFNLNHFKTKVVLKKCKNCKFYT